LFHPGPPPADTPLYGSRLFKWNVEQSDETAGDRQDQNEDMIEKSLPLFVQSDLLMQRHESIDPRRHRRGLDSGKH